MTSTCIYLFGFGANKRFEKDAPTAGFTACFRAPQAEREPL